MLRIGTYLILLVMLFSSEPFLQLAKFPKLLQHYGEHAQRNHDISFVDFLSMHYWGEDANDKDDDKDRQLPFKDSVVVGFHYDVAIAFSQMKLSIPTEHYPITHHALYNEAYSVNWADSLFHPPQGNA